MLLDKAARIVLITFLAMQIGACTAARSEIDTDHTAPSVSDTLITVQQVLAAKSGAENATFEQAVAVLTKGLRAHPGNSQLLRERANMYAALHDYASALSDLKKDGDANRQPKTLKLFVCMLIERVRGYTPEAKDCYIEVVREYKESGVSNNNPSSNYVLASLMSMATYAERVRRSYLSTHNPANPMYMLFKDFNREQYLRTVLPLRSDSRVKTKAAPRKEASDN